MSTLFQCQQLAAVLQMQTSALHLHFMRASFCNSICTFRDPSPEWWTAKQNRWGAMYCACGAPVSLQLFRAVGYSAAYLVGIDLLRVLQVTEMPRSSNWVMVCGCCEVLEAWCVKETVLWWFWWLRSLRAGGRVWGPVQEQEELESRFRKCHKDTPPPEVRHPLWQKSSVLTFFANVWTTILRPWSYRLNNLYMFVVSQLIVRTH